MKVSRKKRDQSEDVFRDKGFTLGLGNELEPITEHQDEVLKSYNKISFPKVHPEGGSQRSSGRSSRKSGRGQSNIPESLMKLTKEFQEDQEKNGLPPTAADRANSK